MASGSPASTDNSSEWSSLNLDRSAALHCKGRAFWLALLSRQFSSQRIVRGRLAFDAYRVDHLAPRLTRPLQ